jgi:monovalent cation:H+ antiporter-2, CPA2 family
VTLFAASVGDASIVFLELGAVALVLAALARLADRLGIPAIPFYLVAGLAVGEGGIAPLDVSAEFISVTADIGVLLLLLTLGLEYSGDELRAGLRSGGRIGAIDAALNFMPGFGLGLLLGWDPTVAILLGGVTWISSSGVISKILDDYGWMANRETPAVLNLLVIEDLAMAVYLPVVGALVADRALGETALSIAAAVTAVAVILVLALRYGGRLSGLLTGASDESLLLSVFGLTLLVGGLAEQVQVSAAIGAFLVGLALSGPVQHRAGALIRPLRDLFAAVFFLFFSFQLEPSTVFGAAVPGAALAFVGTVTKMVTGSLAARPLGVARRGQRRAGAELTARGEFSIVIASLGAATVDGADLGAVAAAFVLITAVVSPILAKIVDRSPAGATSGSVP